MAVFLVLVAFTTVESGFAGTGACAGASTCTGGSEATPREDRLVRLFYDNFDGTWVGDNIIGWMENEAISHPYKCAITDGGLTSPGHIAIIWGQDKDGVNNDFSYSKDLNDYSGGELSFWVIRASNWKNGNSLFFELYYNNAWHESGATITLLNTGTIFEQNLITLISEMIVKRIE